MLNNKKKKKSTTKYKKAETSYIIPVIAILEVIILVAVSSYAWFFFNANKSLSSGVITVEADSGLEIDFKDADKSTYIDIFDYIDKDSFYFEPASSTDGRNIVFPTSGTFNNTDTASMIFRDGTVNDINSKYIDIDFELTNTTSSTMEVYLSNNSSFVISDSGNKVNGKALRLAFYNNDGNSGNVASNLVSNISKTAASSGSSETTTTDEDEFTVYFLKTDSNSWSNVKAYLYDDNTNDGSTYEYTNTYYDSNGDLQTETKTLSNIVVNSGEYRAWSGSSCVNVSGNLYSYTFSNPYKTYQVEEDDEVLVYTSKTERLYDRIIFNNGSSNSGNQTGNITFENSHYYTYDGSTTTDKGTLTTKTVYFLKPNDWSEPRAVVSTAASSGYFAESTGEAMTQVTTGIYSYTFPSDYTYLKFIDTTSATNASKSTTVTADKLYYFPSLSSGAPSANVYTIDYSTSSIYFYNTKSWDLPYAYVNAFADEVGKYTYAIPMISLSGNLFYCSVPTPFLKDKISDSTDTFALSAGGVKEVSTLANNCQVYFADASSSPTERTILVDCESESVYSPTSTTTSIGGITTYSLDPQDYSEEINVTEDSYAVISPGVSAGFQRAANPVNKINYTTGAVESIVPTFASSFDDFIMGSGNPVFTIGSEETVNMSMIVWLEGTDAHCTGENYAGKNINLYLEFSTLLAGDAADDTFTYRFVDSTEQVWTSDTITNSETGVTVSPVMQLYDATLDRGYIMKAKSYTSYAGKKKVEVWECTAPQSLTSSNHLIQFRRVNPYDESEVWNRWEAGNLTDYREFALSNRVVTFTAFADGSPDYSIYDAGTDKVFSVPEYSCGGLWGAYDTEILTVYDGRSSRDITSDGGALNFGYTYTYPGSTTSVTIEYKASGYRDLSSSTESYFDGFYSIVVPSTIYTCASNSYFRNYKGFNDAYAINSDKNSSITLYKSWSAGTVAGCFYEFNEESGSSTQHSYWGSDILYIQTKSDVNSSFESSAFNQVHFYPSDSSADSFYSYLYSNSAYKGEYGENSYVAVVPNDKVYSSYRVDKAKNTEHSTIWEATAQQTLYHSSTLDTSLGYTAVLTGDPTESTYTNNCIISLEYYLMKIWFSNSNWGSGYQNPTVSYWNNDGGTATISGDVSMTQESSNNQGGYNYYAIIPEVSNICFRVSNGNYSYNYNAASDGMGFYPDSWNSSDNKFGLKTYTSTAITADEGSIKYDLYSAGTWPAYTPKSTRS